LAYRIRREFKNCSVFWIPASDMESLHQAYAHIAQRLNIPGWDDENADFKKLVQLYLSKESAGQWLLIFDITDEARLETAGSPQAVSLIEYLPVSDQGAIVFTTTDRKTAVTLALQDIVELPEMEQDIAQRMLEMFLTSPANEQEVADLLLKELAYLPLAIVQAAAYVNINKITLRQYLLLLAEQKEEVVEPISKECENAIATTWLISFEQIRRQDTLAADYLLFMACVDQTDVPLDLLPTASPREKGIDAVGTLDAYSFVSKRTAESALDLHRLVHLSTRNWLKKQELLSQRTQVAITRLLEVFPDNNHGNRSKWRRLLPHAKFALLSSLPGQENEARTNLVFKYAMALLSDGRFNEAEIYFNDALQSLKEVLSEEHPSTLTSMGNLASTFWNQGRWKEAEDLEVQVVEARKRVLGQEHPDTLTSRGNLASTYRNQGRWKEAEDLEVQVVETRKRVLGQEHPSTLTSMANLASTFWNQGRWKEAEDLFVQVMKTRKRVLGQEHPSTLTSMANLASTYRNQGRWKEAEDLEVQVMETSLRVLGQEHPDTLTSMGNLASTFWKQGRWKEAEDLEVQVMETSLRVLGQEHPSTLTSIGNLASTYRNQGRWKEAEDLEVQVMETRKRVLGQEHPSTLTSMGNLASTYRNQGRWKEAEDLEVQVIETRKRVLGQEHPSTLTSMGNLASTYRNQGRWKEAEDLEVQVMETRKRVLGQEHPDTLTSMSNLAFAWKRHGRDTKALKLIEECVMLRTRILGASHPYTLSSFTALLKWQTEKLEISGLVDKDLDM
jgi:tetratricopeptide (TPR) repeat protein